MKLEWVTNSSGLTNVSWQKGETPQQAQERSIAFEAAHIRGAPRATEAHTVEELKQMGVYGLYRERKTS